MDPTGVIASGVQTVTDRPTLYRTSDGRYLTGWQLERKLTAGEWTHCLTDRTSDTVYVESSRTQLLAISRHRIVECPEWIELRSDGERVWVGDRRRTLPPSRSVVHTLEDPDITGSVSGVPVNER